MPVRDVKTASEHLPGMSSVANREATRFMSYSQPYADGWLNIESDGTRDTTTPSAEWRLAA